VREQREPSDEPIDAAELEAVIRRFVDRFVIKSRRARAYLFLTSRPKQRIETLQKPPEWLDRALQAEIGRRQQPRERFAAS
jgi:hypothetical protein